MSAPSRDQTTMAVVADGLTRRFDDFVAVDDVSFAVPVGQIFGFLGPNGAGKTTTIRMLLGILRPSAGSARVLGLDVERSAQEVRRVVGYVSQRFGLYDDLRARENLEFYAATYGVPRGELARRVASVIEQTGLSGRERERTGDLPTGFRQRLGLACAIVHEPRVLFLDEPTAGVDPISRRRFWDLLYDLADEGRTVFVTTHYMDEAENCHRLAFLLGGRLVVEGSPAQIRDAVPGAVIEIDTEQTDAALAALRSAVDDGSLALQQLAPYGARIRAVAADAASARLRMRAILAAAGVDVRALDVVAPSLEDAFIASARAHG